MLGVILTTLMLSMTAKASSIQENSVPSEKTVASMPSWKEDILNHNVLLTLGSLGLSAITMGIKYFGDFNFYKQDELKSFVLRVITVSLILFTATCLVGSLKVLWKRKDDGGQEVALPTFPKRFWRAFRFCFTATVIPFALCLVEYNDLLSFIIYLSMTHYDKREQNASLLHALFWYPLVAHFILRCFLETYDYVMSRSKTKEVNSEQVAAV